MGTIFSDLKTNFQIYVRSSIPAFGAVFIGVYFVTPMLVGTVMSLPGADFLTFELTSALMAGGYAIIGNLVAQKMSWA